MNKRFKKEERAQFVQQFNATYSEEILSLCKILGENNDLLQAKVVDVDRGGIEVAAIERNGEIHQIKVPFQKRIYTIQEASKAARLMLQKLTSTDSI